MQKRSQAPGRPPRKEVAHTSRHNEFSIGASASLWECMLNQWLGRLYKNQDAHTGLQFEARIAQRQSLVKQLHERQRSSYYY